MHYFLRRQKVTKKLAGHTHKIQFRTAHFTTRLRLEQIKTFFRIEAFYKQDKGLQNNNSNKKRFL